MIKLVVSDMDGTLLNRKGGISGGNVEVIKELEKNNIEFAIASGRDFKSVYSIMNQYDIACEAILGNGAQYVDQEGNIIMSCYMDKTVIEDVLQVFHERNIPYIIYTTNGFFTLYEPSYVRKMFIERGRLRFHDQLGEFEKGGKNENAPCNFITQIDDLDDFLKQELDIIKIEAFSVDENEIPPAKELLKDIPNISFLSSFIDNVEVTHKDAQKGYILEKVIKLKGISKNEVMVVGDGMNDLSMFECFSYSFATANAVERIKELSYKVVSDCEEDGFKEAVESIIK